MPDQALVTLRPGEYPIIHSDCGCHDRRPTWIRRVNIGGLIRSVSKKGCFPDNSACEGYGQGLSLHTSLLAHGGSSPVLSSLLTLCIFLPCLQTSILCLYFTLAWWFTQFLGWSRRRSGFVIQLRGTTFTFTCMRSPGWVICSYGLGLYVFFGFSAGNRPIFRMTRNRLSGQRV